MTAERDKWNARYRAMPEQAPAPCDVLRAYSHLLPGRGRALDLAAGRGGNALHLARLGLEVEAWDLSSVAMAQLRELGRQEGLAIAAQSRDVVIKPPEAQRFDVIVVSRFLHRPLCPLLIAALRPSGLLYYQTFTRARQARDPGPHNPHYLLEENELLRLFAPLRLLAYREAGDPGWKQRREAWLVGRRV